jgi:hypothetical protein
LKDEIAQLDSFPGLAHCLSDRAPKLGDRTVRHVLIGVAPWGWTGIRFLPRRRDKDERHVGALLAGDGQGSLAIKGVLPATRQDRIGMVTIQFINQGFPAVD